MVEEGEGTGMKKQNKNKIKEGNRAVTAVLYILAAIAAFITLYPMYYVLILSLSEPAYAATMRVYLVPKGFNLSAYRYENVEGLCQYGTVCGTYHDTYDCHKHGSGIRPEL